MKIYVVIVKDGSDTWAACDWAPFTIALVGG
jgi:hypothetical protein